MTITLVITAYERGPLLQRSLLRLKELTLPDQIIVVDDGSYTRGVHGAVENSGLPIEYVYNNNPGDTNPCLARNIALLRAECDEILVSEPELLFLSDVVAQFKVEREAHPDWVLCEPFCYHEPRENATLDECNEVPGFYVNMFKRQWLLDVGGWDEDLPGPWGWDDVELYKRLELIGHQRVPVWSTRVRHQWHPSRIEPAVENETYVRAKEFPRDIVANRDRELGRVLS